jgi:hypothetical protein
MSAENFHTIKKLPPNTLIVEPPPEFADNFNKFPLHPTTTTPSTVIRTTHIHSYASRLTQNIIAKAIRTFDRRNLATKEIYCEKHAAAKLKKHQQKAMEYEYLRKKRFTNGYSIYGSDSFLDSYNKMRLSSGKNSNSNINIVEQDDDIYDEPNTEYDVIYKDNKDTILCTKRIVRSLEKKKMDTRAHLYCNTDDLYYEKFKSKSCNPSTAATTHCASNNKFQSNSFQKKFDKFLRSKFLTHNLTPTTTTSSIFYSFCRAGTNNSNPGNPTAKSSLNSRLSSSHNSLTVPTNKADDSIFITQAMSHDQLGTHSLEINDFYNVPMDSDIYTLPCDVIHQEDERQLTPYRRHRAMSDNNLLGSSSTRSHKFHRSKNKRSKRKKRSDAGHESTRKMSSGNVVTSQSFTVSHEYNRVSTDKTKSKPTQTSTINNNNVTIDSSVKYRTKSSTDSSKVIKGDSNNNSKYASTTSSAKKSQFSISLNLKQKFCSIFRFRRSHQSPTRSVAQQAPPEAERKVNLSTRALPPLPGLGKIRTCGKQSEFYNSLYFADDKNAAESLNSPLMEKKRETTMDFAANIEKVREVRESAIHSLK